MSILRSGLGANLLRIGVYRQISPRTGTAKLLADSIPSEETFREGRKEADSALGKLHVEEMEASQPDATAQA